MIGSWDERQVTGEGKPLKTRSGKLCRCGEPATKRIREGTDVMMGRENYLAVCDGHAAAGAAMNYEVTALSDKEAGE